MKKNITEELKRINRLMGLNESSVLNEQIIPRQFIKELLKGDEPVEALMKLFKLNDTQVDNVVRRINTSGGVENLSDDVIEMLSRNTIDSVDDIAMYLTRGNLLGSNFDQIASKIFEKANDLPIISVKIREDLFDYYRKELDKIGFLNGADDLKNALHKKFKNNFDDTFSNKITVRVENMSGEIDDIINGLNQIEGISEKQVREEILNLLEKRGKKISQFYTKSDMEAYIDQAYAVIRRKYGNSFEKLLNNKESSELWGAMTPVEKETIMKDTIEKITKDLPWGPNPITWSRRLLKGYDGKWSWSTFIKKLRNIWFSAMIIQVFREIFSVVGLRSDKLSGVDMGPGEMMDDVLNGRSLEEFIFGIVVPPIEWMASFKAYFTTDRDFKDLKGVIITKYKDNLYHVDEDIEGTSPYKYYIKKGGIVHPIRKYNSVWWIDIPNEDGSVYTTHTLEKGQKLIR